MSQHLHRLPRVLRLRSPQIWCARCGLPIAHGAAASGRYGTGEGVGGAPLPSVAGAFCCCRVPDPVSASRR